MAKTFTETENPMTVTIPELQGTRPGTPPHALALHAALERINSSLSGQEHRQAMREWTTLQGQHLTLVPLRDRQLHAQLLTPSLQVGTVELSCLILGSGTSFFLMIVLWALRLDIDTLLMITTFTALTLTLGMNFLIKKARHNAFLSITADAERYLPEELVRSARLSAQEVPG